MKHEQLPIAFKVRTQGRYTGAKGGEVKPGGGGAGALWYVDKTFTVATHQDQWLLAPVTQGTPTTFPMSPANHQGHKLKYLSVCSGMEAATVAWHPLGWEPVGFSEIEPFPCAILKHRFPNTQNYGSLTEYQSWPIEPGTVDLLVGGTPCQSFSVAGLRKGMQDPRGNLALTFLGLADKLRPRWIVWENVPGVLSSNGGRDFGAFLGALGQLGYGWAYRVLDAQHFGVPQRRRRVFVVATSSGDGRLAGEVLSLPEGLRGYLEARRKKGQGAPSGPAGGVDADGPWWDGRDTAHTLTKKGAGGEQRMPDKGNFGAVIQPKPVVIDQDIVGTLCARDYKGVGNQYVQEGKCIPCETPIPYRKAKRAQSDKDDESWVEGEVSNTLNNFDLGDTRTTHAVVEPIAIDQAPAGPACGVDADGLVGGIDYEHNAHGPDEVTGPLLKGSPTGGGHPLPAIAFRKAKRAQSDKDDDTRTTHAVVEPIPIQDGREIEKKQNGLGIGQPGDPAYTIDTTGAQAAGVAHCSDVAPTVTSSGPPYSRTGNERVEAEALVAGPQGVDLYNQTLTGDVHVPLRTAGGHGAPACTTPMAVRRLTPVECERLQGFPDNWSRIPWKGKPEEDCPDGPRYKACGNSMAVPVMRWIGTRIAQVEARQSAKPQA